MPRVSRSTRDGYANCISSRPARDEGPAQRWWLSQGQAPFCRGAPWADPRRGDLSRNPAYNANPRDWKAGRPKRTMHSALARTDVCTLQRIGGGLLSADGRFGPTRELSH